MPRKIAVVTGSRAEYGLLRCLLKKLANDDEVELQLLVTGAHLSTAYGKTRNEIIDDGLKIDWEVDLLIDGDTSRAISKSVGLGVIGFTDALSHLKPEVVVLLGDRFEILAASQAAFFLKIPIAHIHGGEVTLGAIDDCIRHAITKLASLHFVSTNAHQKRVIQMGELPERVFNVGAVGLENLKELSLLSKNQFLKKYRYTFAEKNFLIAFYPVTKGFENSFEVVNNIIKATKSIPKSNFIINGTNADEGGRLLLEYLRSMGHDNHVTFVNSFGVRDFLSALSHFDVLIGNSSSGIIEAPSVPIATVNVGQRQAGRERAPSVIDCDTDFDSIQVALEKACSKEFDKVVSKKQTPYASQGYEIAMKIVETLKQTDLASLYQKPFFDINLQGMRESVNV